MSDINPSIPQVNEPNSTADPKIVTALNSLVSAVNNIETANLADASVSPAKLTTASLNYFLKLTTSADKKVEFGTGTITLSSTGGGAGTPQSGSVSVTHGMGLTPSYIFLTAKSGGSVATGFTIGWSTSSVGGTTFTANAYCYGAAADLTAGTLQFYWVAIG